MFVPGGEDGKHSVLWTAGTKEFNISRAGRKLIEGESCLEVKAVSGTGGEPGKGYRGATAEMQ